MRHLDRVFLPQWVAGVESVSVGASPPDGASGSAAPAMRLLGPTDGCEFHRFGARAECASLFEGFLFRRAELIEELGLEGPSADGARIVAAAWERWGTDLFDRLDGSYLLAVWDGRTRRLIVGHDALGHHPVFFHHQPEALWFATNVLALAHCGRVPCRPDRLSLALLLQQARPARGRTFFEGIERLAPGTYLEWRPGEGTRAVPYWCPVPEDDEPALSAQGVFQQFEPMLVDSVGRRMELRPDGIMLSGGLDSVCIAALSVDYTRQRNQEPIRAYSARHHPDDPPSYEEEMQDKVVERLGMRHHTSNEIDWLGETDLIAASLEETTRFPGPNWIFWTGGYMGFARYAARAGHRIFLTGSGGDEWLSVQPRYAADLLRALRLPTLARFIRADCGGGGKRLRDVLRYTLWTSGLRLILGAAGQRWLPGPSRWLLDRRMARQVPATSWPDASLAEQVREILSDRRLPLLTTDGRIAPSFYRQSLREVWRDSFLIWERETSYHAFREAGVIYVSPYHDRTLLEFLCRIPTHLLFAGGRYKGMVRGLAAERLPGLGLESQRKVYSPEQTAAYDALPRHLPAAWRRVGCARLAALGLAEPAVLGSAFDNVESLGHYARSRLYAALSAEEWLRANFDGVRRSGDS